MQEIVKSSHSCNGGTITIIGSNHNTVDREIEKLDPQFMPSALIVALSQLNPYVAPIEPGLMREIEKYRKSTYALNTKNRKIALSNYFVNDNFYGLSLTEDTQTPIIDAVLSSVINTKITALNAQPSILRLQN